MPTFVKKTPPDKKEKGQIVKQKAPLTESDISADITASSSAQGEGTGYGKSGDKRQDRRGAIQQALEQLGVGRDEVEITVVREGRSGILGLGAEEAIVRVKPLVPVPQKESEIADVANSVLRKLLALMGVEGCVVSQAPPSEEPGGESRASITFSIEGDDLGILIGRRGQTLACLQYIVRIIVGHQTKVQAPIVIDVEGYKQRRYQSLQIFARQMAEQVKTRGAQFTLEPMPAYERRIIHLTLADHPDVVTESIGQGEARRVVILLKKK